VLELADLRNPVVSHVARIDAELAATRWQPVMRSVDDDIPRYAHGSGVSMGNFKFTMSQTRRSKLGIACGFVAVCWLLAWVFGRLLGLQIIGLLFAIAGAFAFVGLVKTMIVGLN
jgi:hypothetical protein